LQVLVVSDVIEIRPEVDREGRAVRVPVIDPSLEPREQRVAHALPDFGGHVERIEEHGQTTNYALASGRVDPNVVHGDVHAEREEVAAHAARVARRHVERPVADHRPEAESGHEFNVPRLTHLDAEQVKPPRHLTECECTAKGIFHRVGAEEHRHARGVAAVVRVDPGT